MISISINWSLLFIINTIIDQREDIMIFIACFLKTKTLRS